MASSTGSSLLFLQNRTHRAGAQTSLARLLRHEAMRRWNPVLVCSRGGWLASESARLGVALIEEDFPRSRSVLARLYGNAAFARRVCRDIDNGITSVDFREPAGTAKKIPFSILRRTMVAGRLKPKGTQLL